MDPKDLKIQPQIASSWKISDDGLNYEFDIRKNVYFHPSNSFNSKEDRLLTPEDIQSSIERACSKNDLGQAPHAYSFVFNEILGAEEFLIGKAKTIAGLKIKGSKLFCLYISYL